MRTALFFFLSFSFLRRFYPGAKHSRNLYAVWFLVVLPVLHLAVSAAGSARLRTPSRKRKKRQRRNSYSPKGLIFCRYSRSIRMPARIRWLNSAMGKAHQTASMRWVRVAMRYATGSRITSCLARDVIMP